MIYGELKGGGGGGGGGKTRTGGEPTLARDDPPRRAGIPNPVVIPTGSMSPMASMTVAKTPSPTTSGDSGCPRRDASLTKTARAAQPLGAPASRRHRAKREPGAAGACPERPAGRRRSQAKPSPRGRLSWLSRKASEDSCDERAGPVEPRRPRTSLMPVRQGGDTTRLAWNLSGGGGAKQERAACPRSSKADPPRRAGMPNPVGIPTGSMSPMASMTAAKTPSPTTSGDSGCPRRDALLTKTARAAQPWRTLALRSRRKAVPLTESRSLPTVSAGRP